MNIKLTGLILAILFSTVATAQALISQGALFSRCYAHLTGRRVPSDHILLIDSIIKNNHSNTVNNCMKIFDKARLRPLNLGPVQSGHPESSNLVQTTDMEGVQVLNTFHALFSQFFEEMTFSNAPQTYSGLHYELYEPSADALYILRATFEGNPTSDGSQRYGNQLGISSIIKSRNSLTGRRILPQKYIPLSGQVSGYYGRNNTPTKMHGGVIQRSWYDLANYDHQDGRGGAGGMGYLTGIKVWPENRKFFTARNGEQIDPSQYTGKDHTYSRGGGIIGSSSFLLKNGQYADGPSGSYPNKNYRVTQDGAVRNRRRAIKNLYASLLCIEQPPLRMDDAIVLSRVNDYRENFKDSPSSQLPFRNSQLCASCHVAYDEAAAVLRNTAISPGHQDLDLDSSGRSNPRNTFVFSQRISEGSRKSSNNEHYGIFLQHADRQWGGSRPQGIFHFRNYRGEYISKNLPATHQAGSFQNKGIVELGEAMAETDQFYACMTKRVFNFFTGINISLEDHGDSRLPELTAVEKYYRDQMIEPLAIGSFEQQGLKDHQSMRQLVYDIISSDIYKTDNLRMRLK